MAYEITGTREWLVILNEKFPDKEFLSKRDACKAAGKCYNTLMKHFPELKTLKLIPKHDLAKLFARKSLNLPN